MSWVLSAIVWHPRKKRACASSKKITVIPIFTSVGRAVWKMKKLILLFSSLIFICLALQTNHLKSSSFDIIKKTKAKERKRTTPTLNARTFVKSIPVKLGESCAGPITSSNNEFRTFGREWWWVECFEVRGRYILAKFRKFLCSPFPLSHSQSIWEDWHWSVITSASDYSRNFRQFISGHDDCTGLAHDERERKSMWWKSNFFMSSSVFTGRREFLSRSSSSKAVRGNFKTFPKDKLMIYDKIQDSWMLIRFKQNFLYYFLSLLPRLKL